MQFSMHSFIDSPAKAGVQGRRIPRVEPEDHLLWTPAFAGESRRGGTKQGMTAPCESMQLVATQRLKATTPDHK